jgi:hypothetical protein
MYAIASSNRSGPDTKDERRPFEDLAGLTSGLQTSESFASSLEIVVNAETLVVVVELPKLSQEWQVFFRILLAVSE